MEPSATVGSAAALAFPALTLEVLVGAVGSVVPTAAKCPLVVRRNRLASPFTPISRRIAA